MPAALIPRIVELAAPAVPVMVLSGGLRIGIPQYNLIVRTAKERPDAMFPRSFCGWWPVDGREIMRQFRRGVMDRINLRGGLVIREASEARIHRALVARVRHECRWCGTPLGRYAPKHDRFCEASCKRSYHS